jgi:hypothetical protein
VAARERVDYDDVRAKLTQGYKRAQENYQLLIGSPDTVIEKAKAILSVIRPGIFTLFHVQGPVENQDRLRSLELMGKHVVPALRAYAKELDLPGPYERRPGSVELRSGEKRLPVVDLDRLKGLGFSL